MFSCIPSSQPFFQVFLHVLFHSLLASIHSIFFLVLLLSVSSSFHSLLFLPLFSHSISSVLSSFLLSFLHFTPPSIPPFFCPSIISCFHTSVATIFPSFSLAFLFLPSFLLCFFLRYFPLISNSIPFLLPSYMEIGDTQHTVDSKSSRQTSVY